MPKRLQPNLEVSQQKIKYETTTEISEQDKYFSLAKRTDLHLAKCMAQCFHNRCCNMVLWAEVVTMW